MTKRPISFIGSVCVWLSGLFLCAQPLVAADSIRITLPELYRLADEEARLIRMSEASLRAANEGVQQAKNNLLPHVNVAVSGSYIGDAFLMSRSFSTSGQTEVILPGLGPQKVDNGRQPGPHWGNTFTFEASQVIYAGGALIAGIEMAKLGERIAELDVSKNRQEVRFLLTGGYLDLVKTENQLAVIDQHIALTDEVLAQMRAREKEGVVLRNDLMRYELQRKQLELTRVRLTDAQAVIRHQIQTMLHRPEEQLLLPDTTAVAKEYNALEQAAAEQAWQARAESNNLLIRQSDAAQQISEQKVRLTRAASIPSIALVAKDELFGPYTTDLIPVDANVNAWFVGIGIQYDLGSLWHNHRAIRQAKRQREASQEQNEQVREEVKMRVHAAYIHFLTAFTEVETQQKQVELADENYSLVHKRYSNQLALLTDLLDASSVKLQADMALVNARVDLLYNYYQLKYITHTL